MKIICYKKIVNETLAENYTLLTFIVEISINGISNIIASSVTIRNTELFEKRRLAITKAIMQT